MTHLLAAWLVLTGFQAPVMEECWSFSGISFPVPVKLHGEPRIEIRRATSLRLMTDVPIAPDSNAFRVVALGLDSVGYAGRFPGYWKERGPSSVSLHWTDDDQPRVLTLQYSGAELRGSYADYQSPGSPVVRVHANAMSCRLERQVAP